MPDRPLKVATHAYDQVRALFDGSVRIDGVAAVCESPRIVTEIFKRMIVGAEFDVAELGFTYYLRLLDRDGDRCPLVALPVFLARVFRHSAVYVNRASGIRRPRDLAGKRIGELALYGHDAGLWAKGAMADDDGFDPARSSWLVGGLDFPMEPVDYVPLPHPPGVTVENAPAGADLGEMLESGAIDALISADVPRCVLRKSAQVGLLYDDVVRVERDYHARTGMLPIMHTLVMKRDLAAARPELVRAVYDAFVASKAAAMDTYRQGRPFNHIDVMIPWFSAHFDTIRDAFAEDWWPYGMRANRAEIETELRYHAEQGLTRGGLALEQVFTPELLDT